jgi:uncharacterized damage-inducible protein DinB
MRATAQDKKEKLISGLIQTRAMILDAASSLSPEQQDEIFLGIWSVKDLLAHLVGWDLANLQAAKEVLAGELPSFYSHYDRDWKSYNARLVAQHRTDDFAALLSLVRDSQRKLIEFLNTVPAAEFHKDRGVRFKGYKVTIARLLQADMDDVKTHYAQIREFSEGKSPQEGEGP